MLERELVKLLIRNAVKDKKVLRLKEPEEFYYVKPHYVIQITKEDIEKLKKQALVLVLEECSLIFYGMSDDSS